MMHWQRGLVPNLVALGLGLVAEVGSTLVYNYGDRVSGAVLHYEFPRDECVGGTFTDAASAPLFGNLVRSSATACTNGVGVGLHNYARPGGAQVLSSSTAAAFLAAMNGKTSFSLEFWKESSPHNDATAEFLPIVTVGAVGDEAVNTCEIDQSHITYSLIATESEQDDDAGTAFSSGGEMDFRFHSYQVSSGADYCPKRTTLTGFKSRNASHLVVTVAPGNPNTVTWYTDGAQNRQQDSVGLNKGGLQLASLWQ